MKHTTQYYMLWCPISLLTIEAPSLSWFAGLLMFLGTWPKGPHSCHTRAQVPSTCSILAHCMLPVAPHGSLYAPCGPLWQYGPLGA